MTIARTLLPAKFMSLITHLLTITVALYSSADNVLAGISNRAFPDSPEYQEAEDSVTLCCIFMIIFIILEFLLMFFGLTILNHQINLIRIILTVWYTFENWSYTNIWSLFWSFVLDLVNKQFKTRAEMRHFSFFGNVYNQGGKLEELLNSTTTTVDDLLEEDSIMFELKNSNDKLIQFLEEEKLKKILNYIITVPTDPKDKSKSYKFPYVSSQILSSDHKLIKDFFIKPTSGDEENNDKFANFETLLQFTNQEKINYTLSGYFMKVANMIILSKPAEALSYILENKSHLYNMKKHIYSKSISSLLMFILNSRSELLNKLVTIPNPEGFFQKFTDLRVEILSSLVKTCYETADDRENLEIHLSSSIIVNDALQNVNSISDGDKVICKLFEDESLIRGMLEKTDPGATPRVGNLTSVICHIISLVKGNKAKFENIGNQLKNVVKELFPKYGHHLARIANGEVANKVGVSTVGANTRIFGKMNFHIIDLISELTKFDLDSLDDILSESGIPKVLPTLIVSFPWHNLMHGRSTRIIKEILEGDYPKSQRQLVNDSALFSVLRKIVETKLRHKKNKTSKKTYLNGYLGYLKEISKMLEDTGNEVITECIANNENWTYWKDHYLDEQREIEARDLGGVGVRQSQVDLESSFDFSIEDIKERFKDFLNPPENEPEPEETSDTKSDMVSVDSSVISGEQNVDDWLRQILPSGVDEVEDEYDPKFDSQLYFQQEQNMKVHDLLEELNL